MFKYLSLGFFVSIGFGVGKILTLVLEEIIFTRLHSSDAYKSICKKVTNADVKPNHKNTIGFSPNNIK